MISLNYTMNVKKVELLHEADFKKIVSLNRNVESSRYLILDIWNNPIDGKYQQILLQLNDIKIFGIRENRISFDLTDHPEYIQNIVHLENKCIEILKRYLHQINRKGKFNFMSLMKSEVSEENKKNTNTVHILTLSTNPSDYAPSLFDSVKTKVCMSYFNGMQKNNTVNMIVEPYAIQLDWETSDIVIDIRLRLVIENKITLQRFEVSDPELFIHSEKQETIYSNTPKENGIFKEQVRIKERNNLTNDHIKKNFDLTQTEVFDDDHEHIKSINPSLKIKQSEKLVDNENVKISVQNVKISVQNCLNDSPQPHAKSNLNNLEERYSDADNTENIINQLIEETIGEETIGEETIGEETSSDETIGAETIDPETSSEEIIDTEPIGDKPNIPNDRHVFSESSSDDNAERPDDIDQLDDSDERPDDIDQLDDADERPDDNIIASLKVPYR